MQNSPNLSRKKPVFKIAVTDDNFKFQPLPKAPGLYPYHLDLTQITPELPEHKLVFYLCGDTGGIVLPTFQHLVASEMIRQYQEAQLPEDRAQFFFHLGDVVYNFGQAEGYYEQFFEPFRDFPVPIFAIAGNHDGDVDPLNPLKPHSLDAFMQVFCGDGKPLQLAGDTGFKSNIQPNVYWTLKTPLADMIGLYCNVPRFGVITEEQRNWFIEELKSAGKNKGEKALILCMHDAPYSADTNHGSGMNMQLFLSAAFEEVGVWPDIVFSGHVHNYQRLVKQYPNGKNVPFIVSGAGGYAQLHPIAPVGDPGFPDTHNQLDGVELVNYCDFSHGFMKVGIEKNQDSFLLKGEYYLVNDGDKPAELFDTFEVDLRGVRCNR